MLLVDAFRGYLPSLLDQPNSPALFFLVAGVISAIAPLMRFVRSHSISFETMRSDQATP
ncbi:MULTISPECIES: hypothetical protein [Cyanophyceae]|uniref:hypothetical protein n=1 Tax=Cyanophyceae TaxID=3028117 RepID=UPI001687CBAB|nr:hypothetical protein [Trichocoleus sp. FACHB-69]MBD1931969.1 hypothetical protein [Trichocoleus sp. FACHB-69]